MLSWEVLTSVSGGLQERNGFSWDTDSMHWSTVLCFHVNHRLLLLVSSQKGLNCQSVLIKFSFFCLLIVKVPLREACNQIWWHCWHLWSCPHCESRLYDGYASNKKEGFDCLPQCTCFYDKRGRKGEHITTRKLQFCWNDLILSAESE